MKKSEAENALRPLCRDWATEVGMEIDHKGEPSFSSFISWLDEKGYGHFLEFRSSRGPRADAESWFDQELKQSWRN